METNYLKAVFWDYPVWCDPQSLEKALRQARADKDKETLRWIMARFLERGRFRDAAVSFPKEEVRDNLDALKISQRARRRWKRFLEVYGGLD